MESRRQRRRWRLLATAALAITGVGLATASPAFSATFFVRTVGSDDNDGLTPETAFGSIRHAGRFLLNAGDRVVVGPGDYLEGNIEPRRSGESGSPIAFVADTAGGLTGDPPGPVRIRPDGARADETTGFLLFGRRDVHIEGFTIIGATDAGIQVRGSAQTGGTSANIRIVDNTVNGNRHGVDVHDAAHVTISANRFDANAFSGVSLSGAAAASTGAVVSDNVFNGGEFGIVASAVRGGRFERNRFEQLPTAIRLNGGRDLLITGSTMRDCTSAVSLRDTPEAVVFDDNLVEGCRSGLRGLGSGALVVARNRFRGLLGSVLPLRVSGAVVLDSNEILDSVMVQKTDGFTTLVMRNNLISRYGLIEIHGTASAEISGNRLEGGRRVEVGAAQIVAQDNDLVSGSMVLRGASITFSDNRLEGIREPLRFTALDAVVTNNDIVGPGAGLWHLVPSGGQGLAFFSGNRLTGGRGLWVRDRRGGTDAVILENRVSGAIGDGLRVESRGSVQVSGNEILQPRGNGISLRLDRNGSTARVDDNVIAGGGSAGIRVTGAHIARIRDNDVGSAAASGIVVRNGEIVEMRRNQISETGNDAINVAGDAILHSDCNRDGFVTAEELRGGIDRLFDDDPGAACSALGPNRHGRIAVNELVQAVMDHVIQPPERIPSRQVEIADNRIDTSAGAGILAYALDLLTVSDNQIRTTGHTALSATAGPSGALTLADNTIETSGNDCILVSGGGLAQLSRNSAGVCAESGVRIRDTHSVSLESSRVGFTAEPGVLATRGALWSSRANEVHDSGGGIALIGAAVADGGPFSLLSVDLEDELIERSAGVGLLIGRAAHAVAAGCRILESSQHGVAIRGAGLVRLLESEVVGAGLSGVSIGGILQPGSDDVVLDGNLVSSVAEAGLDVHATGRVLVTRSEIEGGTLRFGAGVSIRHLGRADGAVAVSGNRVRGGIGHGILVEGAPRAFVWDNVVFSALGHGVTVSDTDAAEVVNTLAYANLGHGVHLRDPGAARVFNNTLYGNGDWGLASEGATSMSILNNILDANSSGSVVVAPGDAAVITEGFNLTTGTYLGLEPAESDLFDDPDFVNPPGDDGILGDDGADDDDFRLRAGSPAIDAGSGTAEFFGISGSATEDGIRDTGLVDLGFHYDASPRVP